MIISTKRIWVVLNWAWSRYFEKACLAVARSSPRQGADENGQAVVVAEGLLELFAALHLACFKNKAPQLG